jgi:hypothetical protein
MAMFEVMPASDRHEGHPEDGVADATERAHEGDADGADGGDVNLLLLHGQDDAHGEGDEERVDVEELHVVGHGQREVFLVVRVDLLETGRME